MYPSTTILWVDPLGLPPPLFIQRKVLDAGQDICYNDQQVQDVISKICGNAAAIFCLLRLRVFSMDEILYKFFKIQDGQYLRNSFFSKLVTSSLTTLRDKGVIDWEAILSAANDFLNKNL